MLSLIGDALEQYVHAHTTPESDLYERLREETYREMHMPQMQVGRVEGQLLKMLVQLTRAREVLEIGTFTGFSGLSLASGLPEGGRLTTCDVDPEATSVARRYFEESPWGERIDLRLGPALDTIAALAEEGREFDLVFIDADKGNYVNYYEATLPLVPTGGLIVADNTLWSGKVLEPAEASDHAIVEFNRHVTADERTEQVLLSVRDGIMLVRKR